MLGIFSAFIFFSNFSIDFTFLHNFEFHLFLPHMNTISTIKTKCFFGYFKPTAIYHVIILFLYFLFFYLFAIFACFTYHFAVFLPSSEDNESFQHWQEYPNENPLLTFLTRSSWTSPGGSGRTLLFRHPITSPHTSVQPATQATKSPASSPQQLIQHTPDIQHPGCAHTGAEVHQESWQHPSPRGGASTGANFSHKFMNPLCSQRSSGFIFGRLAPMCWYQISQPLGGINANKTAQFVLMFTSQSSSVSL